MTDVAIAPPERRPRAGWRIVAAKELADHLLSVRLYILLLLVGLLGVASVYAAAGTIRDVAPGATEDPAIFLRLFTVAPERFSSFSFLDLSFSYFGIIGLLVPLLGIAFGFDGVNNERAQGTLPRLVSQPIHRDDVINGKFVAGLAVIALNLLLLTAVVAGLGIFRLGLRPETLEVARLLVYLAVAVVYAGVWLAFALLCSVLLRRAATSALVTIAAWLLFTIFSSVLAGLVADAIAPAGDDAAFDQALRNARMEITISRFSPETLYREATLTLLAPDTRSVDIVLPEQADRAVPGVLTLPQSLLLVWQQITALVALTIVLFAAAYVAFMHQEIRA